MFKNHLDKSNVTYWMHLKWALYSGLRLIYSGIASIIHGFLPSLFDGVAPKTIIDIYHKHLKNHPNKDYKEMIEHAEKDC